MPHRGEGPIPSRLMIIGEYWGNDEEALGKPFVGSSGQELNRMMNEAGLMRSEAYCTNLINAKPPQGDMGNWVAERKSDITKAHVPLRDLMVLPVVKQGYDQMLSEIEMVQPNVIVTCGNYGLWALTGLWGVLKWRGSHLKSDLGPKVIPTVNPAAVLREWSFRTAMVNDLRRAAKQIESREYKKPDWRFTIRPNFSQVIMKLQELLAEAGRRSPDNPLWLELDLETVGPFIDCCGVGWSRTEGICIPFMTSSNKAGYWNEHEEAHIVFLLYKLLTHRNVLCRLQNGLYDAQYTQDNWHFVPRVGQDTMISQHSIFSDAPKALAYQASIYCDWYVYWKDEGKRRNTDFTEEGHWAYNCQDLIYTRECGEVEQEIVKNFKLEKVHEFQQALFWPVLKAMLIGCRVDEDNASKLAGEIQEQIAIREQFIVDMLGYNLNIDSHKQMCATFYDDLQQQPIWKRAKKGQPARISCDDDSLKKIGDRQPLLRPLTNSIADLRTLGKFLSDFVLAKRDKDGRMRSSFNIGGSESGKSAPKTFRLSSSKNARGSGANLQTIPSEKSKSVGKWDQRQHFKMIGDPYSLPNLRAMYKPDIGRIFFNGDLDRADLQVMAWDADEPLLKEALRKKADMHLLNVYVLDAKDPPPIEELVETHPKYWDHRGPRKLKREFAKVFCHATDYLGKARTVAAATGRTVHETERAQNIYLGTYKGIKTWQDRIIEEVKKRRYVENKFGYRWYIFDRVDDTVMPEAVAWIPQSTVSIVINRIWMSIFLDQAEGSWDLSLDNLIRCLHRTGGIDVLLQVHDSLAGQFPLHLKDSAPKRIEELSKIVVPYEDPLIIPFSVGTSDLNWGAC